MAVHWDGRKMMRCLGLLTLHHVIFLDRLNKHLFTPDRTRGTEQSDSYTKSGSVTQAYKIMGKGVTYRSARGTMQLRLQEARPSVGENP